MKGRWRLNFPIPCSRFARACEFHAHTLTEPTPAAAFWVIIGQPTNGAHVEARLVESKPDALAELNGRTGIIIDARGLFASTDGIDIAVTYH